MAGNTFNTGKYVNAIFQDSSNNIGIGAAPSGTYKFEVTGTAKISGITTFGSTLSNGTYAYTLPSATGTLALTSQIPTNPVGGTGTTNYLPKFTASSTIGNSLVYDDGTGVAVNGTTIGSNLAVTSNGTLGAFRVTAAGYNRMTIESSDSTTNLWNIDNSSGTLRFFRSDFTTTGLGINGAVRMSLTDSGNLGLGVTPSAWSGSKALDMEWGGFFGSNSLGSGIVANAYYNGTNWIYRQSYQSQRFQQDTDGHKWFNAPSGTSGNAITFTQAMTLFANGNLAVGTSTDSGYKLDVNGTGRFSGALSGTSASFSGNVVLGTTALSGGGAAQWLTANGTSYGGGFISSVSGVAKAYYYYDNSGYAYVQGTSGVGVKLIANNVDALTIASTGNVGIGMTPISGILNTNGDLRVYRPSGSPDTYFETAVTDVTTTFTGYDPDGYMSFIWKSNVTERMRITSGGNVLIGTTTDSGNLVQLKNASAIGWVNSNSYTWGLYKATNDFYINYTSGGDISTGTTALKFTGGTGAATFSSTVQAYSKVFIQRAAGGADTLIQFKNEVGTDKAKILFGGTNEELSFYAGTGATENMRITNGGQILMGLTSDPLSSGSALVVKATGTTFAGGYQRAIEVYDAGSGGAEGGAIVFSSATCPSNAAIYSASANPGGSLVFATNAANTGFPTDRLTISATGVLNATSNSTTAYSLTLGTTQATSPNIVRFYSATDTNNTNQFIMCDAAASVQRMSVRTNGGIYNYTTNNVVLSDERLKKDITPLESVWNKVKGIEIVKYKFKDQSHDDFNMGVIAQQVELIAPELIDLEGFGTLAEDGTPYKGIYESDIHYYSIKALQECMSKIEEQQAQIEELKQIVATINK